MTKHRICSIPDCDNTVIARGWCTKHYKRWYKYGDPLEIKVAEHGEPMAFIQMAAKSKSNDCIIWPFGKAKQYGTIRINGKTEQAHKVCLELSGVPRPYENYEVCHAPLVCHNKRCINPNHLRWDSRSSNSADTVIDGTMVRGEKVHTARLTEQQVLDIRSDSRDNSVLAKKYGVTYQAIYYVRKYKSWAWLKTEQSLQGGGHHSG